MGVEEESQCPESECPVPPDDSDVLTCRYESLFIADNCADFPIDDGWVEPDVESFCFVAGQYETGPFCSEY